MRWRHSPVAGEGYADGEEGDLGCNIANSDTS